MLQPYSATRQRGQAPDLKDFGEDLATSKRVKCKYGGLLRCPRKGILTMCAIKELELHSVTFFFISDLGIKCEEDSFHKQTRIQINHKLSGYPSWMNMQY